MKTLLIYISAIVIAFSYGIFLTMMLHKSRPAESNEKEVGLTPPAGHVQNETNPAVEISVEVVRLREMIQLEREESFKDGATAAWRLIKDNPSAVTNGEKLVEASWYYWTNRIRYDRWP